MLQRLAFDRPHPLHDTAATRRLEAAAIRLSAPHTLMQRAGAAVARLAEAIAPHAGTIWLACGAGNNGGDGLEAAALLHQAGRRVVVSWTGRPDTAPANALASWQRARDAGVLFQEDAPSDLGPYDLCIDALLGIGLCASRQGRAPQADLLHLLRRLRTSTAPVLCVDVPSGLIADTGQFAPGLAPDAAHRPPASPRQTLSLLTLHPGLFTGLGRDEAGTIWFDDLGVASLQEPPAAWLSAPARPRTRAHASHKGSHGDVAVIGGEGLSARGMGMTGAALLAASAALHGGAGRVMLSLLDGGVMQADQLQPECMLRRFDALVLEQATVVCGCGGGHAVRAVLPEVLRRSLRLVLDADALNAVAEDPALQDQLCRRADGIGSGATVITPHPLEAARLLNSDTGSVQADRLQAAQELASRYRCAVVLKGSGSVVASPGQEPRINPTGNGQLATGGTGDVLAGLLGAVLAAMPEGTADAAFTAALRACWMHGEAADAWPASQALTASALARALAR
jgi:ADP-dependent NAD(P)H-hydrate dehydratase / NAD(P)H-hydrate epimerase